MSAINAFLLTHDLRLAANPCISPDFCLDWPTLRARLLAEQVAKTVAEKSSEKFAELTRFPRSRFMTAAGTWELVEDRSGDHAWILSGDTAQAAGALATLLHDGISLGGHRFGFPSTWTNLLTLKNLVQDHDAGSTIFPTATGTLAHSSLGVGARLTTLHWPAVEWAMTQLRLSLTANQNSIPRELVYDVDALLAGTLDTVPFPFIGANVPEGHQGQSVEGMSHGAVLSKLKTGFHRHRIAWGFNADHQPIGGKFDAREDRLVAGALLASYITFDLSPELTATLAAHMPPADAAAWCAQYVDRDVLQKVEARVASVGVKLDRAAFERLLASVWPALRKMAARDVKYAAGRSAAFSTPIGRAYFRELSIDELPGLTTPETLATMLALCEALAMPVQFVAPAFGFQKNFPFGDNVELERRVQAAWAVCRQFGVAIGFHSGSGKSAENYQVCGRVTGGALEVKTSGRYTFELGVALAQSTDASDQALWRDWYAFTRELALSSAFAPDVTEQQMARQFISHALDIEGRPTDVFAGPATCQQALAALQPSPNHMFWFEYNFLFVLAADGRADKDSLGDHGPAGYAQRARFYAISAATRLRYAKNVVQYLCFLAEHTGLATTATCAAARRRLEQLDTYAAFLDDIG